MREREIRKWIKKHLPLSDKTFKEGICFKGRPASEINSRNSPHISSSLFLLLENLTLSLKEHKWSWIMNKDTYPNKDLTYSN